MASSTLLALAVFTAALVSVVRAGVEPLHDIFDVSYPASYFVENITDTGFDLPAGNFRITSVAAMPGLRTLGNTFTTFTINEGAFITPHYHDRASEMIYILAGQCNLSFISQDPENPTIFTRRTNALFPGSVAINPRGQVHWFEQTGKIPLYGIGSFDAEDTGSMFINKIFTLIPTNVLQAAFTVSESVAKQLIKETNFPFEFAVKG